MLQHPPVPATLVQPSSANEQWTSSWPCASSMARDPRVERARYGMLDSADTSKFGFPFVSLLFHLLSYRPARWKTHLVQT